ncbi:hypothetical protein GCM10010915_20520 [Microbacterium faecale]|uniref:Uncharacterized protein n=1 Tax=Microbacterium faecale TaxID=1804630 RepID=A0A916YCF8_9MICO|nr:hypothetical protein GCM10010915_20520 [Microbacterium faecale]
MCVEHRQQLIQLGEVAVGQRFVVVASGHDEDGLAIGIGESIQYVADTRALRIRRRVRRANRRLGSTEDAEQHHECEKRRTERDPSAAARDQPI